MRDLGMSGKQLRELCIPLFFQSFDPEDERATVKVLEALSRFENVSDLPEATLKVVLANQALRGRLREADASNDEIFELVREEVLAEHQNTVNVLQETKGVLAITEASLAEERLNREKSEQTLVSNNARLNDAEAKLAAAQQQAAEAEALAKQAELDAQTKLNQKDLELSATESTLLSLYKQRFAITFVLVPAVIGVIAGYLIYPHALGLIPDPAKIWGVWVLTAACGIFPLTLACAAGHWYVARHQKLETWWLARFVLVGKKALVAPALMAVSSAFQGGVWDGIKSIVGW